MLVWPPHIMTTLLPMPRKPLSTPVAEALAVAEQQHDGDQAPDDAEHGEAGAQAVAHQAIAGSVERSRQDSSLLRAQAFHGAEVGGSQGGVGAGEEGDERQCDERSDDGGG